MHFRTPLIDGKINYNHSQADGLLFVVSPTLINDGNRVDPISGYVRNLNVEFTRIKDPDFGYLLNVNNNLLVYPTARKYDVVSWFMVGMPKQSILTLNAILFRGVGATFPLWSYQLRTDAIGLRYRDSTDSLPSEIISIDVTQPIAIGGTIDINTTPNPTVYYFVKHSGGVLEIREVDYPNFEPFELGQVDISRPADSDINIADFRIYGGYKPVSELLDIVDNYTDLYTPKFKSSARLIRIVTYAFTPNNLQTDLPFLGQLNVVQVHDLTLDNLAGNPPIVGDLVLGQNIYVLTLDPIVTGTPTLTELQFNIGVTFDLNAITTGIPIIDELALVYIYGLTLNPIVTQNPIINELIIATTFVFNLNPITTALPSVDELPVTQVHNIVPTDIASQAPTIEQIHIVEGLGFLLLNIRTQAPIIGQLTIGQEHNLTLGNLVLGIPRLDELPLTQIHTLTLDDLTTAIPTLDELTITVNFQLLLDTLVTGLPVLDELEITGFVYNLTLNPLRTLPVRVGALYWLPAETPELLPISTLPPRLEQLIFGVLFTLNDLKSPNPTIRELEFSLADLRLTPLDISTNKPKLTELLLLDGFALPFRRITFVK